MKMLLRNDTSREEQTKKASFPLKVCMHTLTSLRNDVRGMRAATALTKAGYSVSIIDIERESTDMVLAEEDIEGIHVKHMLVPETFMTTRFNRWTLIRAARMFIHSIGQLLRTPADIYHALDLPTLPACYIVARLRRKPVIFESYDLPLSTLPVSRLSTSRRLLHALLAFSLNYMLPRCAGVVAVSPPIVQEMRKRYSIPEISLIRNIPVYKEVSKTDRLRQYLGLSSDVSIALYQGALQPNRCLEQLVLAAEFLNPNIVIVIMGPSIATTLAELKVLIASKGVADRIKIIPSVPYAELLDWTASADIGLTIFSPDYSLNIRYCLPNKLFEYMMAGLPVLTSPLEAIVDVVQTYDVGQVLSSLAPEDIGEAINSMLKDTVGLAHKGNNALQAARNEFNWEKESLRLLRLYQNIWLKDL